MKYLRNNNNASATILVKIYLCFQEKLAAVEEVLRAALTSEQESVFKTSTSKVRKHQNPSTLPAFLRTGHELLKRLHTASMRTNGGGSDEDGG